MLDVNGLDARNRVRSVRRQGAEAQVNLCQRRRWFEGEGDNADSAAGSGGDGDVGDPTKSLDAFLALLPDNLKAAGALFVTEYRKTNDEAAKSRVKAREAAEKAAQAEADKLAEQGRYQELYEKERQKLEALKPLEERAAQLEAKIKATNEARVNRIPQNMRSVIPTEYSPEKLSEWLDANEHLLTKAPKPNLDGGQQGDGGNNPQVKPTATHQSLAAIARQVGYDIKPEALAAREKQLKAQIQRKPQQSGEE